MFTHRFINIHPLQHLTTYDVMRCLLKIQTSSQSGKVRDVTERYIQMYFCICKFLRRNLPRGKPLIIVKVRIWKKNINYKQRYIRRQYTMKVGYSIIKETLSVYKIKNHYVKHFETLNTGIPQKNLSDYFNRPKKRPKSLIFCAKLR